MIFELQLLVLLILLVASSIDFKKKEVPSFFLTAGIFVVALVGFNYFGITSLAFGVFAFLLGLLLYDLNFFGGIADIKALALIGLLIPNMKIFFLFTFFVLIMGLLYKGLIKFVLNKPDNYQVPFLFAILIAYIGLLMAMWGY